jgi:hypothetical protein
MANVMRTKRSVGLVRAQQILMIAVAHDRRRPHTPAAVRLPQRNSSMKSAVMKWSVLAAVVTLAAGTGSVQAQSQDEGEQDQTRERQVLYPPAREGSLSGPAVDRPKASENADLPAMIRERLRVFEQKREAYLAEQLKVLRQLRGATDAERAQLREQLREQRQAWLEEARKVREQARIRLQEMKRELANHSEVIEAARERAREQAREGAQNARERRGTD